MTTILPPEGRHRRRHEPRRPAREEDKRHPGHKRQHEESDAVGDVIEKDGAKLEDLKFTSKVAASIEGMTSVEKKAAHEYAKRIREPATKKDGHEEYSKFQQGFIKRVNAEAKKRKLTDESGKVTDNEAFDALRQEMFNKEVLVYAAEVKKATRDAKRKRTEELEKLEADKAADDKRNATRDDLILAHTGADVLESVVDSAGGFLVGFAKWLNENCPIKDEWLIVVKMFEALAAVMSLPFKLLKTGIKLAIDEYSTPKQIELFNKLHDPKNKDKLDGVHKEINKANDDIDKARREQEKKIREDMEIANPDRWDGRGFGKE